LKEKASDDLSYVYAVLSHPIRRKIIEIVAEDDVSFTDLMQKLGFKDTSKLTFHLRQMERTIEKTSDGKCRLSSLGKIAHKINVDREKRMGLMRLSSTEEIREAVTRLFSDFIGLLFSPSSTLKRVYRSEQAFLPSTVYRILISADSLYF